MSTYTKTGDEDVCMIRQRKKRKKRVSVKPKNKTLFIECRVQQYITVVQTEAEEVKVVRGVIDRVDFSCTRGETRVLRRLVIEPFTAPFLVDNVTIVVQVVIVLRPTLSKKG